MNLVQKRKIGLASWLRSAWRVGHADATPFPTVDVNDARRLPSMVTLLPRVTLISISAPMTTHVDHFVRRRFWLGHGV